MVECLTKRLSDTKNEWIELTHQQKRYLKVKRLLDILISFAMLVLLSPVFGSSKCVWGKIIEGLC